MSKKLGSNLLFLFLYLSISAQVDYTAHDTIIPPENISFYGVNMGYYPGWKDDQLADIAAGNEALEIDGVGVNTFRPAMFEWFVEQWGYDVRAEEFQHYRSLGMKDHTIFLGYPNEEHQDPRFFCPDSQTEVFANLYEDIWDNGENGTPYNDENYYAAYVYKVVNQYKNYTKFWEVWNEPDFDLTGFGTAGPEQEGNWWMNNPHPCDFNLKAPIFYYVRMLRISYEIIKTIQPDGYVALGGLGYPSFLDAILRNTDNPTDGSFDFGYPHKGGAYFDVLSYHSYPHIDGSMRDWSNVTNGFIYNRHSDEAVRGVLRKKSEFEAVLDKYNYDGIEFPKKIFIITEVNIPRIAREEFIGSDEAQRNFLIKTLVKCQAHDITQVAVYQLGEKDAPENAATEFKVMGLYKELKAVEPYEQEILESGIGFKTTSDLLSKAKYNEEKTIELLLPDNIDGAAFLDDSGKTIYVLWAKTVQDQSEFTGSFYSFPSNLNIKEVEIKEWNYSQTKSVDSLAVGEIFLTGAPIFVRNITSENGNVGSGPLTSKKTADLFVSPNPFISNSTLELYVYKPAKIRLELYDQLGQMLNRYVDNEELEQGVYEFKTVDNMPAGVYYAFLYINGQKITKKLIKTID